MTRRLTMLCLVAGCLLVNTGHAQTLGRLFLTPEKRQQLDAERRTHAGAHQSGALPAPTAGAVADPAAPAVSADGPSRIDGVVRRSAGPSVVWLDGVPHRVERRNRLSQAGDAWLDGDAVLVRDALGANRRMRPGDPAVQP